MCTHARVCGEGKQQGQSFGPRRIPLAKAHAAGQLCAAWSSKVTTFLAAQSERLTSKSFPHRMHFKLPGSGCLKT